MNLAISAEQARVAAAAAEFLRAEVPISRVRELASQPQQPAIDNATWRRFAELGWFGLGLPEEAGGVGLGLPEETLLMREIGRHLTPGPLRSTILAARVLHAAGRRDLLNALLAGELQAGFDMAGSGVDVRPGGLLLRVDASGGTLLEVVSAHPVRCADPGTRLARVALGSTVARVESANLLSRAQVLAAAELLGLCEAVRDMSAEYARTRIQFGRPIGVHQAVKHRCADMAVAAYATQAQVFQAALYVANDHPDASFHASVAFLLASKSARVSTADNIQNHGGIGFTWEHDCHLYLKRALLLEYLFGPRRVTLARVLEPARHEFR